MHGLHHLLIVYLLAFVFGAATHIAAQQEHFIPLQLENESHLELREVTLFSRLGHQEQGYGKSAFSFKHGLRSDHAQWLTTTKNNADLLYGSIVMNDDSDWFSVSMGGENPSKIKDMGALEWADVKAVPILPATPPSSRGVRIPVLDERYEDSSEQRVTKVELGHMYVVHIKNRTSDHYAMFRVEKLSPSDSCTISWKLVPSPEKRSD